MTELKAGDVVAQRYHLIRLVGIGGMGSVYEATDAATGGRRAIKVLHHKLQLHPVVPKRFVREAQAARALSTPHAVKVESTGQLDDGSPYIVMEYLEGVPLLQIVRHEAGRVQVERVLYLADQIAVAIEEAHGRGILHRDLKPENIFVVPTTHGELVKVVDFGISKVFTAADGVKLTQTGMTLGTPQYMPVEQLRGTKDLDGRVDVYALGVILFELFAGVRPYDGFTYEEVILKVATTTAPPLASYRPDLPPGLVQVVDRALARDRNARIGSMTELRRAIAPYWSGRSPLLGGLPNPAVCAPGPAPGLAGANAYPFQDSRAAQAPAPMSSTGSGYAVATVPATVADTLAMTRALPGPSRGRPWLWILMILLALGFGLTLLVGAAGVWWYVSSYG